MTDELSQAEADALLAIAKRALSNAPVRFPDPGNKISVELQSWNEKERFLLDVNRSYVSLSKITYQTRGRVVIILARLDIDGPPHRNPDDTEVGGSHLHLYREGYADKWAFAVPMEQFRDISKRWETFEDFMKYCGVSEPPQFDRSLFS
ncbi:hypothetical protein [Methylosinus sp. Ce-a6]|uniref:DUF6978 family protein n=1 Tax=Methylosinus sp. Ce-a6 TaxID=2172005 RepID=UPI00135B5A81|nr:hypothetical protein [Methylosinus sp. Ce-a6]